MKEESTYQRIYRVVAKIPKGRVATYGQIAALAGLPRAARQVGYALAALRDDWKNVPWHRVINAQGTISLRGGELGFEGLQAAMLKKEGVRFDAAGKVSLAKYRWDGDEGSGATGGAKVTAAKVKAAKQPTNVKAAKVTAAKVTAAKQPTNVKAAKVKAAKQPTKVKAAKQPTKVKAAKQPTNVKAAQVKPAQVKPATVQPAKVKPAKVRRRSRDRP